MNKPMVTQNFNFEQKFLDAMIIVKKENDNKYGIYHTMPHK